MQLLQVPQVSLSQVVSQESLLCGVPKADESSKAEVCPIWFFTLHFSLLPLQSISGVLNSFLILIDANSILKTVISPGLLKNMFAYCDSNV